MTKLWSPDRAWFEARLEGWGGSEAAPLLGVSPWRTAREVVEAKARRIIPDPDAPERLRLRLGRDMEGILLEHLWETLLERGGSWPRPRRSNPDRMFRMPGYSYVTAHADGFIADALVELKTDEWRSLPWGDEQGDPAREVPAPYYVQVQHDLAATGKRRAFLFVQIGYHEQLLYEVPRRDEWLADLLEVEAGAWRTVVECRQLLAQDPEASIEHLLPPLEGEELTEHLRAKHPRSTELIRSATAEQEHAISALFDARKAVQAASDTWAMAAARVQEAIGDAAGITSGLGTITWRRSADGEPQVGWELVAKAYRKLIEVARGMGYQLEDWQPTEDGDPLDGVVSLYTTPGKPGSRRFLVPPAWDKR